MRSASSQRWVCARHSVTAFILGIRTPANNRTATHAAARPLTQSGHAVVMRGDARRELLGLLDHGVWAERSWDWW